MGSVPSSQSGSGSNLIVYFYARSRKTEQPHPAPEAQKPLPTAASNPTTTTHTRTASATAQSTKHGSVKVKERQAWYRHLKRQNPVSQRGAKKSALIVRSLIVGPPAASAPKVTKVKARPELAKIKSRLIKPDSANRIIAELRALPATGGQEVSANATAEAGKEGTPVKPAPIHAVCLEHTDADEDRLHFSKLKEAAEADNLDFNFASFVELGSASIDKLVDLMNEIHVIDLITSPDLGLGQPGDGAGILAGALPTPETVIKGIELITPQLMALGYATGQAIIPDHKGVFPPNDRMSVLTYWWGLEVLLPPPSIAYLENVTSIKGAVINFLTALSLVNGGVREILPLVRYISQFIDFEFGQIKKQDKGRGVVCAATWIMPAALVPRPWDFPDPPIPSINPPKGKDELSPPMDNPSSGNTPPDTKPGEPEQGPLPEPKPSNGMPFITPLPMPSILDAVTTIEVPTTAVDTKLAA